MRKLPEFISFKIGNRDLISNRPSDVDITSCSESLCLARQENDTFAVKETGFDDGNTCQRLTLAEEKNFSQTICKYFAEACLRIQRKAAKNQNLAALQKEIVFWSSSGAMPVPQKRRVRRIRKAFACRGAQDPSFSREFRGSVLSFLDKVDQAAEKLILGNMGLVQIIASQFYGKGVDKEDLIQEGNIGLMKAAYRFNSSKARFSTYASFWIRQTMGKAIMEQSRTIRLPCHLYEQRSRFFKSYCQLREKYGHSPEDQEVSQNSGVPMKLVKKIRTTPPEISLDAPVSENADICLGNLIPDKTHGTPDDIFHCKEIRQVIEQILTTLKPKEVEVLRMRFGIGKSRSYTLREIGEKFGVSRERVRQIEKIAMARLRHPVRRHKLASLL